MRSKDQFPDTGLILMNTVSLTTSCRHVREELWCRCLTGDAGSHDDGRLRLEEPEDAEQRLSLSEVGKLDD